MTVAVYDCKPYARARMKALNFVEHPDPFSQKNVPNGTIEKKYQLEQLPAGKLREHQDHISANVTLRVHVWKKQFRRPESKFQEAQALGEEIRDAFIAPQTRLTQPNIKNVLFMNLDVAPLSASNDHTMQITVEFNFLVLVSTRA